MLEPELVTISIDQIVFDERLYPRLGGHDPETVQTYARDMDQIEASGKYVSINADGVLLDGRHRQLAYRKIHDGRTDFEIKAFKYACSGPLESLRLACLLQDKGRSLTNADRQENAKRLYAMGDRSQKEIAVVLGVSASTVSSWLSRTIKEEKERSKALASALWQACGTQEEIAEAVGVHHTTVGEWLNGFEENSAAEESSKWTGFDPPLYNVWKQQSKSNKVDHFGNSEPRWVENLLYLYTSPSGIVVDPFAGSGSTIDICKKRGRRYFVSDRKPIVEREHEIRRHDLITDDGSIQLPFVPRWKDVDLVYLDPPYWKQAEGKYSNDPTDLGNMSIEQFNAALVGLISCFAKKLRNGRPRYIALIIQPTQWKSNDNKDFVDHVGEMLRLVKLPVHMRYSVPYESQQCTAQMVEWAKANRRCLVLTREIIVWEVA